MLGTIISTCNTSLDKKVFSNYRPVSLLPQFSKILERLFNNRLMNFVDKFEILYEGQFGFRNNMSTLQALCQLTEEITSAIDHSLYTAGVFIDPKKAFDTINHDILANKLQHYGIRDPALDWIKNYLSNRKQLVQIDNINSQLKGIGCGVPQGSILGPTLFILYINDMCKVSNILKFILYADDTNIFYSGKNLKEVCKTVTEELKKLRVWFMINKLSLNIAKTNFIIFHSKGGTNDVEIKINDTVIQ